MRAHFSMSSRTKRAELVGLIVIATAPCLPRRPSGRTPDRLGDLAFSRSTIARGVPPAP
jgi:hypothetical protein